MGNDWQGSDRAASAAATGMSQACRLARDAGTDPYGAIGYEAADPALQSALWLDTVSAPTAPCEQS